MGQVIHVDRFGNCITNIEADQLEALGTPAGLQVFCAGLEFGPLRNTYADVAPGEAVALIGSDGRLELALRDDSLTKSKGIRVETTVWISSQVR